MSHKNNQKSSLKTNFLLKLASLSRKSQKGFTLYTAVGLGLLAVAGTTLALAKANKEQTNMTSNEGAKQALAITNGGVNKSLGEFVKDNNAYLLLADYDGTQWTFSSLESSIKIQNGLNQGNYQAPANACGQYNGTTVITNDFLPFVKQIAANETFTETGTLGSSNSSKGSYKVDKYYLAYPPTGLNLNPGTMNNLRGNLTIEGQNTTKAENKGQYLTNFTVNVQTSPPPSTPATAAAIIGQTVDINGMTVFTNTTICTDPGGPGCTNGTTITSTACGSDGVLSSSVANEYLLLQSLLGASNPSSTTPQIVSPNGTDSSNIVIQSFTIPPVPIVDTSNIPKIASIDVGAGKVFPINAALGCTLLTNTLTNGVAVLHSPCFKDKFVKTTINGQDYFLINVKATNFPQTQGGKGELSFQINDTELAKLLVNGVPIDSTKLIIRVYIPQSTVIFKGNAAISLLDGSGNFISGATEKERAQLSSVRLIAADTTGTLPSPDPSWDMGGTTCFVGQIHGPTLSISLPQGNGCNINLDTVASNDYNKAIDIPNNVQSPNVYGTIWAKSITNSSQGASGSFYENTSLSEYLYVEYGTTFPQISGKSSGTKVSLNSAGITGLTREKAQ